MQDRKSADTARALVRSLTDPVFIVSLCCAKKVMSLTHTLSRALQTVNQDLINAMDGASFVRECLQSWRERDEEWNNIEYGPYFASKKSKIEYNYFTTNFEFLGKPPHIIDAVLTKFQSKVSK